MKNIFKVWAIAIMFPTIVVAQSAATSLDEEVNAELDKMYKAQSSAPAAAKAPVEAKPMEVKVAPVMAPAPAAPVNAPTIQIITAPTPVAAPIVSPAVNEGVVSKQPTTVIEASPLVESKADKIRKTRQDAEVATEAGIVEKLEQSRLEDEKKRAEVLFGDKFNALMNQNTAAPVSAPVAAPAPVAPVQAQPVPVVPVVPVEEKIVNTNPMVEEKSVKAEEKIDEAQKAEMDREMVRGEINSAIAELKKTVEPEKPKNKSYVSALIGATDYPDANNVKPQYSLGFAIGKEMNERFVLEGAFQYSNFQVEQKFLNGTYYSGSCYYDTQGNCYPRITEMNQYTTSAVLKYQLFSGMIKPEVGGLFSYTYRTFTDKQFALSSGTVSSQALDMGVVGGIGITLSDSMTVGVDAKYSWNLTNKVDGTALQKSSIYQGYSTDKAIEDLSYWSTNLTLKATF